MDEPSTSSTSSAPTPAERLIVALDVDGRDDALRLIERIGPAVSFCKVGWQLFLGAGLDFVRELAREHGKRIFLDLKMDDIEATVRQAVANLDVEPEFFTLQGTAATVRGAIEGRGARAHPRFLLVTALSSLDSGDMQAMFANPEFDINAYAERRAAAALEAGCDGLIASGESVRRLRAAFPERDFVVVTPGVRPPGTGTDDHRRSLTPFDAIRDGADYLVVGRPVRNAERPDEVAARIIDDIARGLEQREG